MIGSCRSDGVPPSVRRAVGCSCLPEPEPSLVGSAPVIIINFIAQDTLSREETRAVQRCLVVKILHYQLFDCQLFLGISLSQASVFIKVA